MVTKLVRLSIVLIIVAFVAYVVVNNAAQVTVYLTPSWQVTQNLGVTLITTFVLGLIVATLVATYFGVRAYFRERRLERREQKRHAFYDGMLRARGYLSSHEWEYARTMWERMIEKDPTDIIARVELSRCLEGSGDIREALRVIDQARSVEANNVEVLFRAAELNLALQNKTAAIDNLALILYHRPNARAATLARDLSEELGRIDDAIEYHSRIENLGTSHSPDATIRSRLEFKKLRKELESSNPDSEIKELQQFSKRNPNFIPALEALAKIHASQGRVDQAAQLLAQAAKLSGSHYYWQEASRMWIDNQMHERALAAARTAVKESKGAARLVAELDLIRLYLRLHMFEDARKLIDAFPNSAREQQIEIPKEQAQQLLTLKGLCLNQLGDYHASADVWKKLSEYDLNLQDSRAEDRKLAANGEAPAARLSTP